MCKCLKYGQISHGQLKPVTQRAHIDGWLPAIMVALRQT